MSKKEPSQIGCTFTPELLRTTWGLKTWEHPSYVIQRKQGQEILCEISFVRETCLDSDQETIGLLVSSELKTRKIRPLGITVQHLAWRLEGGQANSPGELHGSNDGRFSPGSERCQTVSQQDSTGPRLSHALIFCLWPWDHLEMPSPRHFYYSIFLFRYFHQSRWKLSCKIRVASFLKTCF